MKITCIAMVFGMAPLAHAQGEKPQQKEAEATKPSESTGTKAEFKDRLGFKSEDTAEDDEAPSPKKPADPEAHQDLLKRITRLDEKQQTSTSQTWDPAKMRSYDDVVAFADHGKDSSPGVLLRFPFGSKGRRG